MRTTILLLGWAMLFGTGTRASPSVTLQATTDREVYHSGSSNNIYAYVGVKIAPATPGATITRRNIAFVLDRSGSMAGDWQAALRRAAKSAIATLGPNDVVSVVSFGSDVATIVDAQPRGGLAALDDAVAMADAEGGAALYDAINRGAAELRRNAGPGVLSELLLVTDGPPTKGPRDAADFTRLADALRAENIQVFTIALNTDANEDMLADIARRTLGRFQYVDQPANLPTALTALLGRPPVLVARDAVVAVSALRHGETKSHSWIDGTLADDTLTYRLPPLCAGDEVHLLASFEIDPFYAQFDQPKFGTVKLRWTDAASGKVEERTTTFDVHFSTDSTLARDSLTKGLTFALVREALRSGLQDAIEQLDRGSPRRALRALRNARADADELNENDPDANAAQLLQRFDAYLAQVQPRGLQPLDRKILRSGIFGLVDPAEPETKLGR